MWKKSLGDGQGPVSPRRTWVPPALMPSASASAARKRRYRQRQQRSVRIYPTPAPDWIIETAILAGWLSEADATDRAKVGELLSLIADEWGRRWCKYFGTRPACAERPPLDSSKRLEPNA